MKKLAVLLLSLALLGLLTVPAVAQNQSIWWTLGSSNINNAINVNIVNENIASTGDATAVGNSSSTGIGNFSEAVAIGGIASNVTTNTVVNGGEALAVSGNAEAVQVATNVVGIESVNIAGVGGVIIGP